MVAMIPTSFQLAGMPVTVEFADGCLGDKPSREELFDSGRLLVGVSASTIRQEQNYYREMAAYIFMTMGEEEVVQNERFLGIFSKLLHQALQCIQQEKVSLGGVGQRSPEALEESNWKHLLAHCNDLSADGDGELALMYFLGFEEDEDDDQWMDEAWRDNPEVCSPDCDDELDCDGYYSRTADLEPWTEIAACWQRSDDEGRYYDDEE
jgi:hypothetical protein